MKLRHSKLSYSALLLIAAPSSAFYLPGVAPTDYHLGERVPLNVNSLTPAQSLNDAQLRSVISYDYYYAPLHFCQPEGGPRPVRESLGSILFGDRISTSPFELHMGKDETCKSLCNPVTFDPDSAKFVNQRIRQTYDLNWLIDGLPAGQLLEDEITKTKFFQPGFPLGQVEGEQLRLNNHFDIIIEYHDLGGDRMRVVGVTVQASSRKGSSNGDGGQADCAESSAPLLLSEISDTEVTWTYGEYWRASDTTFATRWDKYLQINQPRIHWFSLVNSAVIVVFLTGMVSTILLRALRKDIARYNRLDSFNLDDLSGTSALDEGVQEDSGWKLVHGDVFRSPRYSLLLSIFLGNGAQLFVMTGITIRKHEPSLFFWPGR